jgi:hypothetical protein
VRDYCSNTATPHPRRDQGLESPGFSRGEDVKVQGMTLRLRTRLRRTGHRMFGRWKEMKRAATSWTDRHKG